MLKSKKLIICTAVVFAVFAVIIGAGVLFFKINNYQIKLTLNGEQSITLEYGDKFRDLGADAALFGKILHKKGKPLEVVTEGAVDASKLGSYKIKYSSKYKKLSAEAERTVTVVDTKLPEIALNGEAELTLTKGNKYEEAGAVATDNYDGDITANIAVDGQVDTSKAGEYSLVYEIKDSSGNAATVTRKVTVKEPPKRVPQTTVNPGAKVVYLTFDDGPGPYTEKLLNILDKYGVKATFFVTNNNPGYNHLFSRMVSSGHAVAIHTATHIYRQIYSSEDAFFADIEKMQQIIKEQTGVTTYLLRFPGGSSNLVSAFNKGIMTRLTALVEQKGYRYFDWNVTSGDAGETESTAQVVKNVINGMASHSVSVVLQHDIKDFSVNAVEQIVQWGLENGYTFKACDMTSPTSHHGINN